MIIYFVRHGEGYHNLNGLYSNPEFELTPKGREEAKAIGNRLKHLPIELLVVSSFIRTQQTAEIINQQIGGKPLIFSDLAVEIKRPSEIAGKKIHDPNNIAIRKLIDQNINDPSWHYSDEENFFDLKLRCIKFLRYLQELKEKQIAIVSHSVFIKALVMLIITGEKLEPEVFNKSYFRMELATSGLTVCSFEDGIWSLVTWNDQSHLGD